MTRYLPANLLNLFAPRPQPEFVAPVVKRRMLPYTGVAQFMSFFTDPKVEPPPEPLKLMNREERILAKRKEKQDKEHQKIELAIKDWDPHNNPKATDEAYKTLVVCRLSYNTSESKLKRDFEQYGPIKQIKMVTDLDGKPRGYAFIEFERERDMKDAYKAADAKKLDDRRILVDVERGRTVKDWKPRKFGGGLGGTRIGSDRVNVKFSGRPREVGDQPERGRRDDDRGRRDDDRGRRDDDRYRNNDRHRDDRSRDNHVRDDKHRDDRRNHVKDDKPRDDRPREPRDERPRDDRPREPRDDRSRDDRPRDDRPREDKGRDDRRDKRDDRHRDDRKDRTDDSRKREREPEEVDDRNVRSRRG